MISEGLGTGFRIYFPSINVCQVFGTRSLSNSLPDRAPQMKESFHGRCSPTHQVFAEKRAAFVQQCHCLPPLMAGVAHFKAAAWFYGRSCPVVPLGTHFPKTCRDLGSQLCQTNLGVGACVAAAPQEPGSFSCPWLLLQKRG